MISGSVPSPAPAAAKHAVGLRIEPDPRLHCDQPTPTYGRRFELEPLGPPPLPERLNRQQGRAASP
jgi:hypothetical protein